MLWDKKICEESHRKFLIFAMANEDSEWKNILKFGGSNKRSRDDEEESPNQRARKNLRVSNSNDQKASNSNKDKRDLECFF